MYKKIDLFVCNRTSSGYTCYTYVCSTERHKTLSSAILSLNGTSYIAEKVMFLVRCKSGMVGYTYTGHNKVLAIFDRSHTSHTYNQKQQAI